MAVNNPGGGNLPASVVTASSLPPDAGYVGAAIGTGSNEVEWVAPGGGGGVSLVLKGPFKFTYADYAALLAGANLWTAAAGDAPQNIWTSVPVTPFDGGTGATVTADSAPTLPVTIVPAMNDTFLFTAGGGHGTPETFTIPPGVYASLATLETAVGNAIGSAHGEHFSTIVAVTDDGTSLVFTMKTVGVPASPQNNNTITEGNGGAAAMGVAAPPAILTGGTGPSLGIYLSTGLLGEVNTDLSFVDFPSSSYPGLSAGVNSVATDVSDLLYIPSSSAGFEYTAKFASDPGSLTQGECYVYGLLYPELIQTA